MNFNIHLLSLLYFFFFGGGGGGGVGEGGGGGFRKLNHYGECGFCGYFLGGNHKTRLILGFIFMHLQVFLSSMYRTGIFLWVAYLLLFFLGWGVRSLV